MGRKRKVRKNRQIKFSEDSYVERNYMKGSKAVIPLELDSIDDLYMKHDYKKVQLSDEVCDYIEEIAYMIPINTDIVIEVHCPKCSEEEQEKIRRSIKNNFGMEIDDIDYDISVQNKQSLILGIVGIIFLLLNIPLDKLVPAYLVSEFFSVAWWVAVWNVIEIQTLEKSENRWKRLNYLQLYDSKITFVFDKEKEN